MATGKVKWFNNAKGYGFILPEDGDNDLFVHYSSIEMDGYKTLKAGQDVEFDVQEGPKGFHAVNIRPAQESPAHDDDHPGVTVEDVDVTVEDVDDAIEDVDAMHAMDQADGESGTEEPPREGAAGSG